MKLRTGIILNEDGICTKNDRELGTFISELAMMLLITMESVTNPAQPVVMTSGTTL